MVLPVCFVMVASSVDVVFPTLSSRRPKGFGMIEKKVTLIVASDPFAAFVVATDPTFGSTMRSDPHLGLNGQRCRPGSDRLFRLRAVSVRTGVAINDPRRRVRCHVTHCPTHWPSRCRRYNPVASHRRLKWYSKIQNDIGIDYLSKSKRHL